MGMYFRMEQRFGHLGIPGLVRILVFFKVITWVLYMARGDDFARLLIFDLGSIYQGEVWRLASFLILPGSWNAIFVIFEVIFLFMIGDGLERAWGPFGVTLYVFGSALMAVLSCLVLSLLVTVTKPDINIPIYASLIMAAGALYPDTIIQLYLLIPVKLKWIGMLAGFTVLWGVFRVSSQGLGSFLAFGVPQLACLIPFALVFIPGWIKGTRERSQVASRRQRFNKAKLPETEAFHHCEGCGATEVSHPDREFRITSDGLEICDVCRDDANNDDADGADDDGDDHQGSVAPTTPSA